MWEVVAADGRADELVSWVRDHAVPALESQPGHRGSDVYRSTDRVVVISHWQTTSQDLPRPPEELTARLPHAWDFTAVLRSPRGHDSA